MAPDYRALLDALGYPPIAGGAPEDDAPEQDQPESAPESGSAQEAPQSESFTDKDASSIPEDADREWLTQRYSDMQADYTRKTQEIAETRREAEAMAEIIDAASDPGHPDHKNALDILGLEADAEDDQEDFLTAEDELRAKVEALEADRAAQVQAAEQAAIEEMEDDLIAEQISKLQEQEGREFDDAELRLLYNEALANPDGRGLPNVEHAYNLLRDAYTNRQKEWVSSKKTARRPGSGSAADKKFDPTNDEDRVSRTAEILEAFNSSE
jgi:hypothetical protein